MARSITVEEFNKEFSGCAVCDKMDIKKYLVILPNNQGVLIYKTEEEAIRANKHDKIDREIVYIKKS